MKNVSELLKQASTLISNAHESLLRQSLHCQDVAIAKDFSAVAKRLREERTAYFLWLLKIAQSLGNITDVYAEHLGHKYRVKISPDKFEFFYEHKYRQEVSFGDDVNKFMSTLSDAYKMSNDVFLEGALFDRLCEHLIVGIKHQTGQLATLLDNFGGLK